MADNIELIVRFHPMAGEDVTLLTTDFGAPDGALQAIARALDERRSLILTHARYNREAGENAVVINLANRPDAQAAQCILRYGQVIGSRLRAFRRQALTLSGDICDLVD